MLAKGHLNLRKLLRDIQKEKVTDMITKLVVCLKFCSSILEAREMVFLTKNLLETPPSLESLKTIEFVLKTG